MSLCADWTTGAQVRALGGPDLDVKITEEVADLAATFASSVLYELTGHRWNGLCTQTVRPCARRRGYQGPAWPATVTPPAWAIGAELPGPISWWTWRDGWGECGCDLGPGPSGCTCRPQSRVPLGAYPVQSITSVKLDGATLVPGVDYRLVDKQLLERAPGLWWPVCQDLFAEATEPDTFEVVFEYGQEPPTAGATCASIYGLEVAQGLAGLECNLPSRVSSILRQGTTVSFVDPTTLAQNGLTGVPLVDTWIQAVNGGKRPHRPAAIASPDRLPQVEYRWPGLAP